MKIETEILIRAPRRRVFALLCDIQHWPEHIRSIERIEMVTPDPVDCGTRFRETRRLHGRSATEEMTVAEIDEPDRFVLTAIGHGMSYVVIHALDRDGAETRLRVRFEALPVTRLARLISPVAGWLLRGQLRRQLEADLVDMKRAAER